MQFCAIVSRSRRQYTVRGAESFRHCGQWVCMHVFVHLARSCGFDPRSCGCLSIASNAKKEIKACVGAYVEVHINKSQLKINLECPSRSGTLRQGKEDRKKEEGWSVWSERLGVTNTASLFEHFTERKRRLFFSYCNEVCNEVVNDLHEKELKQTNYLLSIGAELTTFGWHIPCSVSGAVTVVVPSTTLLGACYRRRANHYHL